MVTKKITPAQLASVLEFIEEKKAIIKALGLKITQTVGDDKDQLAIQAVRAQLAKIK